MSKEDKKDFWDILSIVSSLLIPLSIGIATYIVSKAQTDSDIKSKEQELVIAEINAKVEQATLVSTFLEALVDTNSYKRQLAVKAVLLALPEEGSDIVLTISQYDPDDKVKEFAKESLKEMEDFAVTNNVNPYKVTNIDNLIEMIWDNNKSVRMKATDNIVNNHLNNQNLIKKLINNSKFGNSSGEKAGLINTIFILNNMDSDMLFNNKLIISEFINKVNSISGRPTTKQKVNELMKKISN